MKKIVLKENELYRLINETVRGILSEANILNDEEERELAMKYLGCPSFEEFYHSKSSAMMGADFRRLSEYFKKKAEMEEQRKKNGRSPMFKF